MSITKKSILIILVVLIIDQTLKIIIKTNMFLYQDINILGNWFLIKFIENDGMAFGFDLPGNYGKLSLTLFRIIALIGISFYLKHLIKIKSPTGLIVSISLIFAGAMGNIIDSVIYANIFSESTPFALATMFPKGGGYGTFMHGHVVDMFYFPILRGYYPEWIPWKGGDAFEFFRPIFNIADSSITIGVMSILIFQKRFFAEQEIVSDKLEEEN